MNGTDPGLVEAIRGIDVVETLFDRVPDVAFFIKDAAGRYRKVNSTLVERCGVEAKSELIGRTTVEVFPAPLGERYLEQDLAVVRSARPITQRLELHLYPDRREGWCLTDKLPLLDRQGAVCGIAGLSRDLQPPATSTTATRALVDAVELIRDPRTANTSVSEIAQEVGLSQYQLNRRLKGLLGITARQLLTKSRIDTASKLLRTTALPIGDVAQRSGYFDQSAFTRQFRRSTGLTPRQYRARHRES